MLNRKQKELEEKIKLLEDKIKFLQEQFESMATTLEQHSKKLALVEEKSVENSTNKTRKWLRSNPDESDVSMKGVIR